MWSLLWRDWSAQNGIHLTQSHRLHKLTKVMKWAKWNLVAFKKCDLLI